jgi:hypothetical protein
MEQATNNGQEYPVPRLDTTGTSKHRLGEEGSPSLIGVHSAGSETLHGTLSSPDSRYDKQDLKSEVCVVSDTVPGIANHPQAGEDQLSNNPGSVSNSFPKRLWSSVNEKVAARNSTNGRIWKTTIFRFGPLSGIFCMALALASIVASLGILVGSNGQSINKWSAPPSTYLAILTAVANLSVRYACIQGIVEHRMSLLEHLLISP